MPYAPTNWVDGVTLANAARMNNIENELVALDAAGGVPARLGQNAVVVVDWNNANQNGWYYGANAANAPVAGLNLLGLVSVDPAGEITQEVWNVDTAEVPRRVWVRRSSAAPVWSAWQLQLRWGGGVPAQNDLLAADANGVFQNGKLIDAMVAVAAALDPAKFKGYPADASKYLSGAGTWLSFAGSGQMVPIGSEVVLASPAATIDFTSIPATYKHLLIIFKVRTDRASQPVDGLDLTLNGDTGANYRNASIGAAESAAPGGNPIATASAAMLARDNVPGPANTAPTGAFATGQLQIFYYSDAAVAKLIQTLVAGWNNSNISKYWITENTWANQAAVNRVTFKSENAANFIAGCRAQLYGVV
jgi:hypothetical protein